MNGNNDVMSVCGNYGSADNVKIPKCINNDFCISSPQDMNNGILTLVFADMQPLDSVYKPEAAFCRGTLFPDLNKPFYGGSENEC